MYPYDRASQFQAFRSVPKTGVIYVMTAAHKQGFHYGHPDWANLGQGAPETGPIPDSPPRLQAVPLPPETLEYGTVGGIDDLRQAVADLYNARYRAGKSSRYTAENVAISPGGRSGLTRVAAALNHVNLGHFIPDYTAYEELLDLFRVIVPIPILHRPETGFMPSADLLYEKIVGLGLGAVLLSNPCNPTGQVIRGTMLEKWVADVRELRSMLIIDEFYAHYFYGDMAGQTAISAAAHVEDVDLDPVVMLDGLTKNWRYPGLRLSWTIGPKELIDQIASAGSFLDGGAPHAIQRAAIPLLALEQADREAAAIRGHFGRKRRYFLDRLTTMGFQMGPDEPMGGFYAFVSLENMPQSLRDGFAFFKEALNYKVVCVPGEFFDVNPGKRRRHLPSRLKGYVRLSYGPCFEEVKRGLDSFEEMLHDHRHR